MQIIYRYDILRTMFSSRILNNRHFNNRTCHLLRPFLEIYFEIPPIKTAMIVSPQNYKDIVVCRSKRVMARHMMGAVHQDNLNHYITSRIGKAHTKLRPLTLVLWKKRHFNQAFKDYEVLSQNLIQIVILQVMVMMINKIFKECFYRGGHFYDSDIFTFLMQWVDY